MSRRTDAVLEKENTKRILLNWYHALDEEFGKHGDPNDSCKICYEALVLGLIDESKIKWEGE